MLEFNLAMKRTALILLMAASAAAASAQTPAKPATPAASAAKPVATAARTTTASGAVKLPPGVPPVKGIVKTAFTLRYQEIKIGTGADAEPYKTYKIHYTGWRAADGVKFDSSYDHFLPEVDKDGKPVKDADGKPKLQTVPQPFSFPQGAAGLIPGFSQGFEGMKVGGKRRLFIPWQLAYGARGRPGPDATHPGIPAKADLIFDVELLDVTEPPVPQNRPGMIGMPGARPGQTMPGQTMPGRVVPTPLNHPAAPATPAVQAAPATPAQPQPK
jgi:peptidylprolyl isomerase